jgi:hypothetical protein
MLGDSILHTPDAPGHPIAFDYLENDYPEFAWTNLALPGETSQQILTLQVPAMPRDCKLVVFDAGGVDIRNDVADFLADFNGTTSVSLRMLLHGIRQTCPSALVVAVTYVDDDSPQSTIFADFTRLNAYLRLLPENVEAQGHVVVADLAADERFYLPGYPYMYNNEHENAAGQRIMAKDIERVFPPSFMHGQ